MSNWKWEEEELKGEGTVEGFLTYPEGLLEESEPEGRVFFVTQNRLLWELGEQVGLWKSDFIKIDWSGTPKQNPLEGEAGWTVCIYSPDDPVMILYKDGIPVASMYTSTRGRLYHSDGWIVDGDRQFHASNASTNKDTWEEEVGGSNIAREAIKGVWREEGK